MPYFLDHWSIFLLFSWHYLMGPKFSLNVVPELGKLLVICKGVERLCHRADWQTYILYSSSMSVFLKTTWHCHIEVSLHSLLTGLFCRTSNVEEVIIHSVKIHYIPMQRDIFLFLISHTFFFSTNFSILTGSLKIWTNFLEGCHLTKWLVSVKWARLFSSISQLIQKNWGSEQTF